MKYGSTNHQKEKNYFNNMKTILYYNYFDLDDIKRRKEMDFCLSNFIDSNNVDKIFLIMSNEDIIKFEKDSDKIEIIIHDDRPTYEYMFNLIDIKSGEDDYNIIINSDCYIEEDSYKYLENLNDNDSWSLTRWDTINGDVKFRDSSCSQDCWIIKGKPKQIDNINFEFGKPGCDNRISFELKEAGYKVYNPSKDFKVIHYHDDEHREYTKDDRIFGKYLFIDPINISEINDDDGKFHSTHIKEEKVKIEKEVEKSEPIKPIKKKVGNSVRKAYISDKSPFRKQKKSY